MLLRRQSLVALIVCLSLALGVPASAITAPPGAAGIGDAYFPLDGNGGIDVQSYDVHDRYRFATGELSGWTDLRLRGTQAVSSFDLDFLLPVQRVLVDGRRVGFRQRPHELVIRRPLAVGETVKVRVSYRGKPAARGYAGERNWLAGPTEVVAMNQPHMAPWWFPSNDHPRDKALMRISITVPAEYDVIANGRRVGRTVHGGKGVAQGKRWATTTWRADEPMATYLAFFAAGHYRTAAGKRGGTPWLVAVSKDLPAAAQRDAMALMRRTPAIVGWLEKQLGRYPFSTVGGLTTSLPVMFALENQTRPTYPSMGQGAGAVSTVVHELAHQWFGDSVALSTWSDIWLNEGAATYFEWRWDEMKSGQSAARRLRAAYDGLPARDSFWSGVVANPCAGGRNCVDRIFAPFVYHRGAMAFQALRNRIGDDAFSTLLRRWVTERRGGHGTTAEFEALAEEVSGLDLVGFFDAWIHRGTKPADTAANGLGQSVPLTPSSGLTSLAVRLGSRVSDSSASAIVIARRPALMPSQRSGSRSQTGERCPTQGIRVSSVSRRSTRSRSVRPARLVVLTPSPTYPPAQPSPVAGSSPTEAHQSRGMPSAPPQACVTRVPVSTGKRSTSAA